MYSRTISIIPRKSVTVNIFLNTNFIIFGLVFHKHFYITFSHFSQKSRSIFMPQNSTKIQILHFHNFHFSYFSAPHHIHIISAAPYHAHILTHFLSHKFAHRTALSYYSFATLPVPNRLIFCHNPPFFRLFEPF